MKMSLSNKQWMTPILFRSLYLCIFAINLQACVIAETTPEHTRAEYAKTHMVGMSRNAVVGCAGDPLRTELKDNGKTEVLIYRVEFIQKRQTTGTAVRDCEAHITLKDEYVTALNYKGNTGGTTWNQYKYCEPVIRKCVAHLKAGD